MIHSRASRPHALTIEVSQVSATFSGDADLSRHQAWQEEVARLAEGFNLGGEDFANFRHRKCQAGKNHPEAFASAASPGQTTSRLC